MTHRNPYMDIYNSQKKNLRANSIQEMETLAINVGQLHNTLGIAFKDLIFRISQFKRQSVSHVIQDETEKNINNTKDNESKTGDILHKPMKNTMKSSNDHDDEKQRAKPLQTSQINIQQSVIIYQPSTQPASLPPQVPVPPPQVIVSKIKCMICKTYMDSNIQSTSFCPKCLTKNPTIYQID